MRENQQHKTTLVFGLWSLVFIFISCGNNGGPPATPVIEPTPDFTPSEDTSLADMVINTFTDNGIQITVEPEYIDFNASQGTISQNDELYEAFTITNNSGEARSFNFKIYSVSTGFSILDENKQNLGSYSYIEVPDGASKTFHVQFNAWVFGTQTIYITITADIEGYIRLPMRAIVTGPSSFKLIPTSYACTNDSAPQISSLDFYKVAYGQTRTEGIKLCNTGGEDIKITSATIENAGDALNSVAMDDNAFEDFLWQVSSEIDSTFALGESPSTTGSFVEPVFVDYTGPVDDPAGSYSVRLDHNDGPVKDVLVEAGNILRIDVDYVPTLDVEAGEGQLYYAIAMNAVLSLNTSLGAVQIPLLGATSGAEPMLEMSYRLSDTDEWKNIDLYSEGAALYFGTVDIFLDWVSINSSTAQVKIKNTGSGSKDLEFYGGGINGFFEYFWEGDKKLSFPMSLSSGAEAELSLRYLPSATGEIDDDYQARFDFGQFYFQHTGGNGPQGKATLVGEQDAGYAVELYYGGTKLEREYSEGRNQNLCVFSTDTANPTPSTFKIVNNNNQDTMTVNWSIDSDAGLEASPASATVTVAPGTEETFTVNLVADASAVGQMLGGTLLVETSYGSKDSQYASMLDGLIERDFAVPFQGMASESGESNLCNTGVLGDDGATRATFVIDRVTMVMTDLIESAHNPPPFRFHLPLEVNRDQGTVRIAEPIELQFNEADLDYRKSIRSYTHQATNIQGCAPLPTNPYRLEFEKGSWTGTGIECSDDGPGTIKYSTPAGESITLNSDTACMPTDGGEEYIDENGVRWMVVYHDFVKFDGCDVEYYGKIATFAYKPDAESVGDVFFRAEEKPNESEAYYEGIYGAYQYNSYITFLKDTKCGGTTYGPNATQTVTNDPDAIKNCYQSLASKSDTRRQDGFVDECSYFVFSIDEGEIPSDVASANPDYDSWKGTGPYEPHVDDEGETHETKYDITLNNVHIQAYVLGAGDRGIFFSHPGHLVYSDMYVTFTTKRVAEEAWYDGDWQQRVAVNTRKHLDKNQIFLKDGERYDIGKFWTEDGINEEFSNVIDEGSVAQYGINFGGYGKGNFRKWGADPNSQTIIFAGWPVNFDEHNLGMMVGIGAFNGKGNTAPSFAKADAATGQGKPLFFSFHGCLLPGIAEPNQGCFDYHLDDAQMPDGTLLIDEYSESKYGILPDGYVDDAGDCSNLEDAGFADLANENYDVYKYMPCINFKIIDGFDRDRYKNYYSSSNKFDYGDDPYGSSTCGYGN